jgi:hypothetical protein
MSNIQKNAQIGLRNQVLPFAHSAKKEDFY